MKMEDPEWEQIASKLLDSLDQASSTSSNLDDKIESPELKITDHKTHKIVIPGDSDQLVSKPEGLSNQNENSVDNCRAKIQIMDPKYNLTIYRYLRNEREDPIVLEYCNKLIELNFVPCEPSSLDLEYYAKRVHMFDVSAECQQSCVFLLVSYFKCSELKQKLKLAENGKSALFQVSAITDFFESQSLFTVAGHDRFSTLRSCLCIQMQRAAAIENQFVMELLLIRICYCLLKDIQRRKQVFDVASDHIKGYFMFIYLLVKYEYENHAKLSKAKEVATDSDEEYNLPIYPSWRLQQQDPPMCFEKNISPKILERVENTNFTKFDIKKAIEMLSDLNEI